MERTHPQEPRATDPSRWRLPATFAGHAEWAGIVLLVLAVGRKFTVSWRKWPDPLVDFGRELYFPWQISRGAILYRDFDHNYGPLSHYFNALIFRVFGPGLMQIVAINSFIYCASLTMTYREIRTGWGRLAAFAGCALFVMLFSFSQFLGIGNYNFATPYAHETTHGFLLVLVLISIWTSWLRELRFRQSFAAGICCGLSVLLKAEIIVAAGALAICALVRVFVAHRGRQSARTLVRHGLFFSVGGMLPVLIAAVGLWKAGGFPPVEAFSWANNAWLSLFNLWHITEEPVQRVFLGTADLVENSKGIFLFGPLTVVAVYATGLVCERIGHGKKAVGTSVVIVVGAALIALILPWSEFGKVFPAWICLAVVAEVRPPSPGAPTDVSSANTRWLLLVAAVALLARMILNPRFVHYGYYQAALAGVVTMAALFRSMPDLLHIHERGRRTYVFTVAACLACGIWQLEKESLTAFEMKTTPIGEGVDRFYGFGLDVEPTATLVEEARKELSRRPECKTLLVLPEGLMLNYLSRKPSTVPIFMFAPSLIRGPRETRLLERLTHHPPDCVILISRDLQEFGVLRFGDSVEHGSNILAWLDANYSAVGQLGGDPLDVKQRGVILFEKR